MNRLAWTVVALVLALWGALTTAASLRYRREVERANGEAAELRLDVADLQKQLARAADRPVAATVPVPAATAPAPAPDAAQAADRRVLELEASLREKEAQLVALRQQPAVTNRPPWNSEHFRDAASWLDDMKKNRPDEYAEFMKRREESRQRVQRAFAEKADHFLKRDLSKMTDEERQSHEAMVSLLAETWKLSDRLKADLPIEQRRELMSTMRENLDELGPLLENARDNEFYQTGRQIGLSEAQAAQFVEKMHDVLEATSMRPLYDAMRGGGRGGGPPGGPR